MPQKGRRMGVEFAIVLAMSFSFELGDYVP